MPERNFKFPFSLLVRQAGRLHDALNDATVGPPVSGRLPDAVVSGFNQLLIKVGGAPATRAGQAGDVGTLTKEQNDAFNEMLRLMGAARRSAGLAFPGNEVVLHQEFKVGEHDPQGLADEVGRAKVILASAQKYATQLGQHGWIAQDATELETAIGTLKGVDLEQEAGKDTGQGLTAASTTDANKLYKYCLSIQNAARLAFPSTKDGNETPRARYLLGEFPPHGHSDTGGTPPTPTPPAPTSGGTPGVGPTPPAGGGH